MAAVQQYAGLALRKVAELEKKVSTDLKQLWDNEAELKRGLDAAEFNLRAHQKVLNALAVDQNVIWSTLKEAVDGFVEQRSLSLADVKQDDELVKRIAWPYYHKLVEEDLKEISAAQEKRKQMTETATKINAMRKELKTLVAAAEEAGNDPAEVEAEATKLLEQTQRVAEECGKMLRGEAFDESVIAEAQNVIDQDEARRRADSGNGASKEEGKEKSDEEAPVAQEESQHPEGAQIFGG
jgi:septal ring factor EnvC (AmiA/AmiB activator)